MAFRDIYGEDPFYFFFSDTAPELKSAARQELMVHLTSTPHRPESNGVVERFNQLIVDGARCLLLKRLPGRYWHYACRAFSPGWQSLREGQGWEDRMGPALRQGVPRQAHPVRLEGALPAAKTRRGEVRAERFRGDHACPPPRTRWLLQGRLLGLEHRQPRFRARTIHHSQDQGGRARSGTE